MDVSSGKRKRLLDLRDHVHATLLRKMKETPEVGMTNFAGRSG